MHECEGGVDVSQRQGVADKLVHLHPAGQVALHQPWHAVTTLPALGQEGRGGGEGEGGKGGEGKGGGRGRR